MKKTKSKNGWSLNQGLAAQYAAQAGLDPDLAAAAGESAWDVLKALRDAADERDPGKRKERVAQTKRRLSKAGLSRHGDLAKSIHARLASLEGEGPSINPETGLQEFRFECVEGRNGPCGNVADPIQTLTHRFVYDGNGNLTPNQPGITVYNGGNLLGGNGVRGVQSGYRTGYGNGSGAGIGEGSVYDGSTNAGTNSVSPQPHSVSPESEFQPPLPSLDPYAELSASLLPPPWGPAAGMTFAARDTINHGASAYYNFDQGNYAGAIDDLGKGALSAVGLVPGAYQIGKGYGLYRRGFIDDVIRDVKKFNDGMTATDAIRNPDKYYNPF